MSNFGRSFFTCVFVLLSLALQYTTLSHHQCIENPPKLDSDSGGGYVGNFGGLNTYINGSPDRKKAIILASDVYGYSAPILRKIADKVAAAGYFVVVPDFTLGDPDTVRPVPAWLRDHQTDDGFKDAKRVIKALKIKGITTIGAAGFCWGGKIVVLLAKSGIIKATVLLHPSFTSVDDIAGIRIPTSIQGAENDSYSPPTLLKEFEVSLNAAPKVPNFVKVFPNVCHGWTVTYDENDKEAVKNAEEAHHDMLNWFAKYI